MRMNFTHVRATFIVALAVGAVPAMANSAQQAAAEDVEASVLIEGTHSRLVFETDVTRVAVGRSQTLSVEILNSRELLVLGLEPGRTSVFLWFANGTTETRMFSVEPDLSFLREALADIHASITAELAPHKGAVVLRGLVPDVSYRLAAESAAGVYLDSRSNKNAPTPLVTPGDDAGGEAEVRPPDELEGAAVINLIRLEQLPPRADEKIRDALAPMEGAMVSVRRVQMGDLPNDDEDLFVLEGSVRDQVTLTRALFLASRALLGKDARTRNDIKVLADEAGGLADVENLFGSAMIGGGGGQGNFQLGNNQNQTGGGGGGGNNQMLVNRIGANLGRAKVIEAAAGRILSMIKVENLPLVRVDVRLYEVNLTRLREWQNDLAVIGSDFDQGALSPSFATTTVQGANAASVGQDDIQNVVGFLGGEFGNQTQLVSGGLAIDNLFTLLVNQQVARSLSRPTLTVLSGELALFQVGGQVPIPVAVTIGGGTDQVLNGVEFRNFGVQLSVRPLVEELDSETITLDLSPIVSLPDLDLTSAIGSVTGTGPQSTAFETRGTRTHTRLRDGDAMLMSGLISQRDEAAQSKTPWLGDLPLVGWLFRNEVESGDELELVVVVNPVIVRPERPDAELWSFVEPATALDHCLAQVESPEPPPEEEPDEATEEQDPNLETDEEFSEP